MKGKNIWPQAVSTPFKSSSKTSTSQLRLSVLYVNILTVIMVVITA